MLTVLLLTSITCEWWGMATAEQNCTEVTVWNKFINDQLCRLHPTSWCSAQTPSLPQKPRECWAEGQKGKQMLNPPSAHKLEFQTHLTSYLSPWCCLRPRNSALEWCFWRRWRWSLETQSGASRTDMALLSYPTMTYCTLKTSKATPGLWRRSALQKPLDGVIAEAFSHTRKHAHTPCLFSSTYEFPWCSPLETGMC